MERLTEAWYGRSTVRDRAASGLTIFQATAMDEEQELERAIRESKAEYEKEQALAAQRLLERYEKSNEREQLVAQVLIQKSEKQKMEQESASNESKHDDSTPAANTDLENQIRREEEMRTLALKLLNSPHEANQNPQSSNVSNIQNEVRS